MQGNSRTVTSRQSGTHPDLAKVVQRHLSSPWRQPVADHGRRAWATLWAWLEDQRAQYPEAPLWLDSGCGTGFSTFQLARDNPAVLVVGVDQSAERLGRGAQRFTLPDNALVLRAECTDIWRLMLADGIHPARHFLLYPNPWPKPGHLKRRWHGHPVFPTLLALGSHLELRTNWEVYAQEFADACRVAGVPAMPEPLLLGSSALTDFEQKYSQSGHGLWRVRVSDVSRRD